MEPFHFLLLCSVCTLLIIFVVWRKFLHVDPLLGSMKEYNAYLRTLHQRALNRDPNAPKRRMLAVVNPFGGGKRGMEAFDHAKRLFDASQEFVFVDILETRHAGQATQYIRNMDISKIDCIVGVGGDGTSHEIFEGILTRKDVETARLIPIGMLHAGSGNGLAETFVGGESGHKSIVLACQAIIEGYVAEFDASRIHIRHKSNPSSDTNQNPDIKISDKLVYGNDVGQYLWSVMFSGWGLVSEYERYADTLRWLGPFRLDVAGFLSLALFDHSRYKCKLRYKRVRDWDAQTKSYSPNSRFKASSESVVHSRPNSPTTAKATSDRPSRNPYLAEHDQHSISHERDIHPEWETASGHIVTALALGVAYVGKGQLASPFSRINDGLIDLLIVKSGSDSLASRFRLVKGFLQMSSFGHLNNPDIEMLRVSEWCLESDQTLPMTIDIDGELITTQGNVIYGEVLKGYCRAYVAKELY